MKRIACAVTATAMALGGMAVVGCDRDNTRSTSSNTPATTTSPAVGVDVNVNKDKVRDTADRAGDAVQRGLQKTGEVAKEVGRDTKDMAVTAGRKIENGTERAVSGVRRNVDVNVNTNDAQQAGLKGTAASDTQGIRDVLAQVAEAAMTKGG